MVTFSGMKIDPAKLKAVRVRAGVNTAELARIIGVSRPYVSMMETGKKPYLDESKLAVLCRNLGCNQADVVALQTPPEPGRAGRLPVGTRGFGFIQADGDMEARPEVSATPQEIGDAVRSALRDLMPQITKMIAERVARIRAKPAG